ncbi:PcfJ domain-containing protein [Desulfocastanea catecholica]
MTMLSQVKLENFPAIFAAELAGETSVEKRTGKWNCTLSEMLVGEYLIMPLTSAKLLKAEGSLMNNCWREYISRCLESTYCVFSIRTRSGERLATLGIACDDGYWRFDQCLGPSNGNVLEEPHHYLDDDGVLQTEWFATELYYVAHDVVRLMNVPACCH